MPTYTFVNSKNNEEVTLFLSLKEREEFLKENKLFYQKMNPSHLVSGVGGLKPDEGFKDILRTVKKLNPGSNIEV
jgi:hypothetical protein